MNKLSQHGNFNKKPKTPFWRGFGESRYDTRRSGSVLLLSLVDQKQMSSGYVYNLFLAGPAGNRTPETLVPTQSSYHTGPSRNIISSKFGFWTLFVICNLLFVILLLPKVADASLLINRPLYIGLNSGLVGYWSFDGPGMADF